jgi:UTP--glucose-1-phosphate uridylyltransferase
MKVIVPVAGLGTRMLPATKAIPKEMLPVVDKPLIQYVVQEAANAGATELVLVTHASKNSIENHFDTSFELEATLEKRVKRQILEEVQKICPRGLRVISVRQGEPKGLGHAISCARSVVGDEDFAVILPDVLIDDTLSDPKKDNLAEMIALFRASGHAQIMVENVPEKDVDKYGIAAIESGQLSPGQSSRISALVEKPSVEDAPSTLAVVGRYVLPKAIWAYLAKTPSGAGGEIQLTDAIDMMIADNIHVSAYAMKGESLDCGNKLGLMKASVIYGLRHPEIKTEFEHFISTLQLSLKNKEQL